MSLQSAVHLSLRSLLLGRTATAPPLRFLLWSSLVRQMSSSPPTCLMEEMVVPSRQLYGPGPSNMTEPIQQSQSKSLLGHLHPEFVKIMSDVREGLQYVFKTKNAYTLAVSGTGHAGMEAAVLNLLERNERLLCVKIGIWGQRAADLGRRMGLEVQTVDAPEGEAVAFDAIREAVSRFKPHALFVCQGESSTGVCQPLYGLGKMCHDHGALLLVDTVASLGGTEFEMDKWDVDCVYSATQKVLNAPPGLAPISFSQRAMEKIRNRSTRVASFYFDVLELGNYWGCDGQAKRYHHTAPISTVYALRAALAVIAKEGIDNVIARHRTNAQVLYKELANVGLEPFVENESLRLPCLTTVKVPPGVEAVAVMHEMMAHGIEIAGGLGPTVGKIWRIGTFGGNSQEASLMNVVKQLASAIESKKSSL